MGKKIKLCSVLMSIVLFISSYSFFLPNSSFVLAEASITPAQIQSRLNEKMKEEYFVPGKPTDPKFNKKGPCWDFVYALSKDLFGYGIPAYEGNHYEFKLKDNGHFYQIGTALTQTAGTLTESNLKELFRLAQPGDIVQMDYYGEKYDRNTKQYVRYDSLHTMMVYSVSETGVVFLHAGTTSVYYGRLWNTKGKEETYKTLAEKWLCTSDDGISIIRSKDAVSDPNSARIKDSTNSSVSTGKTGNETYEAPVIDNFHVTYSGYKYVELEGTIINPGKANVGYEVGVWENNGSSTTFRVCGEVNTSGKVIKCKVPVVNNFVDSSASKFSGVNVVIGLNGIDSSQKSHFGICNVINYEYKYPIPSEILNAGNRIYYRFDQGYNWEDANDFARYETNGHLVCIDSESENNELLRLINKGSSPAYYIGGKLDDATGNWIWTDNSSFSYTKWIGGKPDKAKSGKTVIAISKAGWKNYSPDSKGTFGFIIEVENADKLLPTAYPTPSPTPNPTSTPTPTPSPTPSPTPKPTATPTPVPRLDTKQARSIVADAMALSYNGMKFYKAYRYDVNGDGVSDLILHSENNARFIIIGYSDSKKVRLYSDSLSNVASDVGFYKSKKTKRLFVKLSRSWMVGSGIWYQSFSKGKFKTETGLEMVFYDYDADKPTSKPIYTYQIGEKNVSKSKYNKKVKSWKLKRLKAMKKTNILKRQTKMSSELIDDAAKYIKSDLFGNKVDIIYRDINGDKIKDCYFVIPGKKVKGYKGIVVSNDNGESNWTDVAVVLQSSKKGVIVKYLSPSDAKKLFKWAI